MDDNGSPREISKDLVSCTCCTEKIQLPKSFFFCGMSQSGKTWLTKEMLLNREHLFDPVPREIIFCYTIWQNSFDELQQTLKEDISFCQEVPSVNELSEKYAADDKYRILVLDDKLSSLRNSAAGRNILDIFTVAAHHCGLACFILSQSLYHSQIQREISLNCHYFLLFKNARSYQSIKIFGSQILPGKADYFMDAYAKATKRPHGYLWIDLSPDSKYMLKTCILPHEDTIVYLPIK